MKNSIVKGLVGLAMAMMVVVAAEAKELPIKILAVGDKSVNLYFKEIEGKVYISVADESGFVFHAKRIKDIKSYAIQYDLSELPDGIYFLELEGEGKKEKVNLVLTDGKLIVGNAIAD